MRLDQFTIKAQEAIDAARRHAVEHDHQAIDVEHLLLALLEQQQGLIPPLLQKVGAVDAFRCTAAWIRSFLVISFLPAPRRWRIIEPVLCLC